MLSLLFYDFLLRTIRNNVRAGVSITSPFLPRMVSFSYFASAPTLDSRLRINAFYGQFQSILILTVLMRLGTKRTKLY